MADTIIKDLDNAYRNNYSIEEIEHIIKTSTDYYGNTGRYDVAMCIFEKRPEMWKEIHKLSVKHSVDIYMKCFGLSNDLIACAFHEHHHNLNDGMNAKEYQYDVYGTISDYIGKEKFDIIMKDLPDFLKN